MLGRTARSVLDMTNLPILDFVGLFPGVTKGIHLYVDEKGELFVVNQTRETFLAVIQKSDKSGEIIHSSLVGPNRITRLSNR